MRGRYNKELEPGRKITCQECHVAKYGEPPPPGEKGEGDEDKAKTKVKKAKRQQPKFSHDLLMDHQKGMVAIYKNFPKVKFKGKGHEASDLRKLLSKYAQPRLSGMDAHTSPRPPVQSPAHMHASNVHVRLIALSRHACLQRPCATY